MVRVEQLYGKASIGLVRELYLAAGLECAEVRTWSMGSKDIVIEGIVSLFLARMYGNDKSYYYEVMVGSEIGGRYSKHDLVLTTKGPLRTCFDSMLEAMEGLRDEVFLTKWPKLERIELATKRVLEHLDLMEEVVHVFEGWKGLVAPRLRLIETPHKEVAVVLYDGPLHIDTVVVDPGVARTLLALQVRLLNEYLEGLDGKWPQVGQGVG